MAAHSVTDEMCATISDGVDDVSISSIGSNQPVWGLQSKPEISNCDNNNNVISSTDFSEFGLFPNTWYDDTDTMQNIFEILDEVVNECSVLDTAKSPNLKKPANIVNQNSFSSSYKNEKMAIYKIQKSFMQYEPTINDHLPLNQGFSTENFNHQNQLILPPTHHKPQQKPSVQCYLQQSSKAAEDFSYLKNFQKSLWQQEELYQQHLKTVQLQQVKQRLLQQQQQQTVLVTTTNKTPPANGPPNVEIQVRKLVPIYAYGCQ